MRLTLRQLAVFVAIADSGSTTSAGEAMALSQSATSSALKELEKVLDVQLFDRVGARLVLNDVGRGLLEQARVVLDAASRIEKEFEGGALAGSLRIGASTTIGNYILPALVGSYAPTHPQLDVDVLVANTAAVVEAVSRLQVDVAFIEGPCGASDVDARVWREDELVIVASPLHPLLDGRKTHRMSVQDLRQVKWLLREPGSGTRVAVEQALLPHLKKIQEGMHFGGTEAIKLAAVNGLGFACMSLATVRDWIANKRLVRVQTTLPKLTRPFYCIQHKRKRLSRSVLAFLDHCN